LACGLGGNALFLAERGLETVAWDVSAVAIQRLEQYAASRSLRITTQVRDVALLPPEPEEFDVVVVCRFLDRSLVRSLAAALRANGLLYYQTFIQNGVSQEGPRNPNYLLEANELLRLFRDLNVCVYRDEGRVGDIALGFRNEAMLVAQRRNGQWT
jgi:SAM-dependent methyltransferase